MKITEKKRCFGIVNLTKQRKLSSKELFLLWMWLLLWLTELWLPSLPVSFRDPWLNSLFTRCIEQLSFLLLLDEKGNWFFVRGKLQINGSIYQSLSSTYHFSEVNLAFFWGENAGHLACAQDGRCRSRIKNGNVPGREEQVEGNSLEESCTPSRVQAGAEPIMSASVDGTVQTPALQRAPAARELCRPGQGPAAGGPTRVRWQEKPACLRRGRAAETADGSTGTVLGGPGRASVPFLNSKARTDFPALVPGRSLLTQPCCPPLLHSPSLPATAAQSPADRVGPRMGMERAPRLLPSGLPTGTATLAPTTLGTTLLQRAHVKPPARARCASHAHKFNNQG